MVLVPMFRMISCRDIYRSAHVLVKQHGQDAPIEAAMRADAMLEAGDLDGLAVWKRMQQCFLSNQTSSSSIFGTSKLLMMMAIKPNIKLM